MRALLLITIVSLLYSCSSTKVLNSEVADNVDWSKYKTYDFYQLEASGDTASEGFVSKANILKAAIANQLNERGFTQSSSNPDMLVNIGLMVKEKAQTRTTDFRTDGLPRYMGQRNYTWKSQEIEVGRYKEGTATIHLVDAAQKKMLWRGVAKDIIPDSNTKLQTTVTEGAKALFEKFPITASK